MPGLEKAITSITQSPILYFKLDIFLLLMLLQKGKEVQLVHLPITSLGGPGLLLISCSSQPKPEAHRIVLLLWHQRGEISSCLSLTVPCCFPVHSQLQRRKLRQGVEERAERWEAVTSCVQEEAVLPLEKGTEEE